MNQLAYLQSMSIYFIRHGQSEFNAAFRHEGDPMIFDAPLTALGREQALQARQKIESLGIKRVISSPLTRAIQTAKHIFDDLAPIEIRLGHHEYLLHSCDVGRKPAVLKAEFPDLDFDDLPDKWWHHASGEDYEIAAEPIAHFEARISKFVDDLEGISDVPLAIVGHGNAFQQIIGRMMENCEIHQYR